MKSSTDKLTVPRWAQTRTAVSFANMEYIKISKTVIKAAVWKRYMDDISSLWDISKLEEVNLHYPTIKFTTDIYNSKGKRLNEKAILDIKTHFKQTETFQQTHFAPCH